MMGDNYRNSGSYDHCEMYRQQEYYVEPNLYYGHHNAATFNYVAPVSTLRSCCYDNHGHPDSATNYCGNVMSCWWKW